MIAKTPNQAYKEYKNAGGTLSFTDFLHREKEKYYSANGQEDELLLLNHSLNDTVQTAIKNAVAAGGLKTKESGKTVFGINKNIVIGSGIFITAALIFLIIKKNQS